MDTVQATRMRPGMVVRHDGRLFTVFSLSHRTPGNKRGFVQTKLRDLNSGAMMEHRFSSEDM
ncbi:MAG: elongation factor P, partial [Candidatus Acidiferrales bacterium]